MKTKLIIIIFIFITNANSQTKDIIQQKLLFHFIEEGILKIKDEFNKSKISDLKDVEINFDTIATYSNPRILFIRFNSNKNSINVKNEALQILFNDTSCDEFIIAITSEDKNYRIKGFDGNDLLFLLKEIHKKSYPQISCKKALSELDSTINGIDFKAIYKALITLNFDAECLQTCSDSKPLH